MNAEQWYDADLAARARDLALRQAQHAAWVEVQAAHAAFVQADLEFRRTQQAQHLAASADRADAERAVASAGQAAAASQLAHAQAFMSPEPPPSDGALLSQFFRELLAGGMTGPAVIAEARAQLAAYRAATSAPPVYTFPE
jgi:hypothetical protein